MSSLKLSLNHPRVLAKLSFAFAFAAVFTFLALRLPQETQAASLENFRPGNIISDYTMSNVNTMSVADIQNFLNERAASNNACGDTATYRADWYPNLHYHIENGHFVCLAEERFAVSGSNYGDLLAPGEASQSAAEIIYEVAHEYTINPQVLLVLLQKEQGLLTDSWPNHIQYRAATGFGCPDTAPCDAQYYGFKNQLKLAADLFRTVLDGGWTNYPLGENYIYYNPNRDCGGSVVNIENLATSSLYRYTPYQPNAAALAAGYGTVTCGAYGNRNFYLYFLDYFNYDPTSSAPVAEEPTPPVFDEPSHPLPDGTYQITSTFGTALDVDRAATEDFSKVWMYLSNGTKAQIFSLEYHAEEDYYIIGNPNSGKVLDIPTNPTRSGSVVQINTWNESCSQKWRIVEDADDNFEIISLCSGKALDIDRANPNLGAKVQVYDLNHTIAQKWHFTQKNLNHPLPDGTYQITSTFGTALDVDRAATEDFSKVWMYLSNGTKAQIFSLEYHAEEDYYIIGNPNSGKVLDIPTNPTRSGSVVQINTWNESCSQKWRIVEDADDNFEIISLCSGKALDIDRANPNLGAKVQVYDLNHTIAQKWRFADI